MQWATLVSFVFYEDYLSTLTPPFRWVVEGYLRCPICISFILSNSVSRLQNLIYDFWDFICLRTLFSCSDALHDLLPLVQFKKLEKHPWRWVTCSNFSKNNTSPWLFFTFLNCTNDTKSHKASHNDTKLQFVLSLRVGWTGDSPYGKTCQNRLWRGGIQPWN